jgi:hypothetical protein
MSRNQLKTVLTVSIIALFICFSSCDIPGTILLINKTNNDAYFNIIVKNNTEETDSIKISSSSSCVLLFGFGNFWTDSRIKEYIEPIHKMEIITKNDTTILTDKKIMFDFFEKRRRGVFKQTIKITLKDKH